MSGKYHHYHEVSPVWSRMSCALCGEKLGHQWVEDHMDDEDSMYPICPACIVMLNMPGHSRTTTQYYTLQTGKPM